MMMKDLSRTAMISFVVSRPLWSCVKPRKTNRTDIFTITLILTAVLWLIFGVTYLYESRGTDFLYMLFFWFIVGFLISKFGKK